MEAVLAELNLPRDEHDIITKALEGTVSNEDIRPLVDVIVRKAISDQCHGSNAAKLCNSFIENEGKKTGEARFRNVLLTKLQKEYTCLRTHEGRNIDARWIAFVTFLSSIFYHIRINSSPLKALVGPVLECLTVLADLRNSRKDTIIQCLVMQLQFHGEELEQLNRTKMAELYRLITELFLCDDTSQLSRLMLLEVIELRAGDWKLAPAAFDYYYGDNNSRKT